MFPGCRRLNSRIHYASSGYGHESDGSGVLSGWVKDATAQKEESTKGHEDTRSTTVREPEPVPAPDWP